MLIKLLSGVVHGIEGELVEIEIHTGRGLPGLVIVGRPGAAVKESVSRVRAALLSGGYSYPRNRVVVNLAPADRPKHGTGLDLPLALGLIALERPELSPILAKCLVVGEVALDGSIRPVRGVFPIVLASRGKDLRAILVPPDNAGEAAAVSDAPIHSVETLKGALEKLQGRAGAGEAGAATPKKTWTGGGRRGSGTPPPTNATDRPASPDFSDVRGQDHAKRALLIAASGGHHVLLMGPPGSGKTLLARCLAGILPPMTRDESIETTAIHSVAGNFGSSLIQDRPFRTPHHTVSEAGFLGGGAELRPGEVSLAHNGVLFLDETLEFPRRLLDLLRQPLEDGKYILTRRSGSRSFPSQILLVGASNP